MRVKMNTDLTITANMGARGTVIEKVDRQSMTFDIKSSGVTMGGFAQLLSTILMQMGGANSRQVIDMTGLAGFYEVKLEWAPSDLSAQEPVDTVAGPSIYSAVQSQLGLKLEAHRGPMDVLVIDSVQKVPISN